MVKLEIGFKGRKLMQLACPKNHTLHDRAVAGEL